MNIIFRSSCNHDLNWFRKYYSQVFPDGNEKAKSNFRSTYDLLSSFPEIGKIIDTDKKIRELQILKTPFSFIYYLERDHILVIRVLDKRSLYTNLG
jgi:toxin ParE1/3/4